LDLFTAFVPEDNADLGDARGFQIFDRVFENGLVCDRDELFGTSMSYRPET
jgi:hypothetical protein